MTKHLVVFAAIAVVVSSASAATDQSFPKRIDLPDGLQPEGIAAAGERFFTGSLETGAVQRKPAHRRGSAARSAANRARRRGHEARSRPALRRRRHDRQRVRLRREHRPRHRVVPPLARRQLRQRRRRPRTAAWFTDSFKPVLYRVPLGAGGRPGAPSAVKTVRQPARTGRPADSTSTGSMRPRTARRSSSSSRELGSSSR